MADRPRAFRLDNPAIQPASPVTVTEEPDAFAVESTAAAPAPVTDAPRRWPWGRVLAGSLASLIVLGLGLWAERLVSDLLSANPALGGVAAALALAALVAFRAIGGREAWGVLRERRIEKLHARAVAALAASDDAAARAIAGEVAALYAGRPETAEGRARIAAETGTLIDADDRLALVERAVLRPLDEAAVASVATASRQVSLVTAVSPRALIDVAFTLYAAARLVRRIAAIYGGRPGFLGFMRLVRAVATQLLVTGGMAAGDSLLSQAMGHGLAARISAKAGEGVLNGLLTARIGLAAIAVCRPLPFVREAPPRLSDVAGDLFKAGG